MTSNGSRVTYHNITDEVKQIVADSGITNGLCVIQSPHTTCSVIFEEYVHDTTSMGMNFYKSIESDFDRIISRELSENTVRYPGLKHLDFLMELDDPNYPSDPGTILNGDAHIRASFFGASESFILSEGKLEIDL